MGLFLMKLLPVHICEYEYIAEKKNGGFFQHQNTDKRKNHIQILIVCQIFGINIIYFLSPGGTVADGQQSAGTGGDSAGWLAGCHRHTAAPPIVATTGGPAPPWRRQRRWSPSGGPGRVGA